MIKSIIRQITGINDSAITLEDIVNYCNIYPDIRNKVLAFTTNMAFIKDNTPITLDELLIQ